LAEEGHYQAIDIDLDQSRVMPQVVGTEHMRAASASSSCGRVIQQSVI
jgi:flagellum-specific ATP synthase